MAASPPPTLSSEIRPNHLATVACPGDGCAVMQQFECPPHCTDWESQCGLRRCMQRNKKRRGQCEKHEPIQDHVNRTLSVIWPRLPTIPNSEERVKLAARRKLILITTTFPHALQLLKLEHCSRVLADVRNVFW